MHQMHPKSHLALAHVIEYEAFAIRCVEAQVVVEVKMLRRKSNVREIVQHYLNQLVYEVESALAATWGMNTLL